MQRAGTDKTVRPGSPCSIPFMILFSTAPQDIRPAPSCGKGRLNPGHILLIGNTIPLFMGVKHLYGSLALLNERVGNQGQEILAFQWVHRQVRVQIGGETVLDFVQDAGLEAPQIHGHNGSRGHKGEMLPILGKAAPPSRGSMRVRSLRPPDSRPRSFRTRRGHGAVLRQGVFHPVAHHGMFIGGMRLPQKALDAFKGGTAIEIIRVDDRKGGMDLLPGAQHRVGGAPGLGAALRNRIALRKRFHPLEGVMQGR